LNAQQKISVASGFIGLGLLIYSDINNIEYLTYILYFYFTLLTFMTGLTLIGFKKYKTEKSEKHIQTFKESVSILEIIPRIGIYTYYMYIFNIPMFIITIAHFFMLWKLFEDYIFENNSNM